MKAGWVLYDGACGVCSRWIYFWRPVLERRGFSIKDLQSAAADGSVAIPTDKLLDDLRVLTPAGQLVEGAGAYLYVTRRIWWTWPFWAVFHLPGFRTLLERGYLSFARNRYCVSARIAPAVEFFPAHAPSKAQRDPARLSLTSRPASSRHPTRTK